MRHLFLISFLIIFIAGCASSMPAPVYDKPPQDNNRPTSSSSSRSTKDDWRPDSYVVTKGDTLYSIGLNHGLDYREIARTNNIPPPYMIAVGQRLNLARLKQRDANMPEPTTSAQTETDNGVIVTPIDIDGDTSTSNTTTGTVPVLTEPKATREPYSVSAENQTPTQTPSQPVATASTNTEQAPVAQTAATTVSSAGWAWPTKGKVIANFGQTKNKGIDIAGSKGQAVTASAGGKVIYAGSDLRGYGKLVIIKHNKSFLSVYAHNSNILVKEGQVVKTGQKIAAMGNTDTDRNKLHFEIRQKGKSVDPAKFLTQN